MFEFRLETGKVRTPVKVFIAESLLARFGLSVCPGDHHSTERKGWKIPNFRFYKEWLVGMSIWAHFLGISASLRLVWWWVVKGSPPLKMVMPPNQNPQEDSRIRFGSLY